MTRYSGTARAPAIRCPRITKDLRSGTLTSLGSGSGRVRGSRGAGNEVHGGAIARYQGVNFVLDVVKLRGEPIAFAAQLEELRYRRVEGARNFQVEKAIPNSPETMRIEFMAPVAQDRSLYNSQHVLRQSLGSSFGRPFKGAAATDQMGLLWGSRVEAS